MENQLNKSVVYQQLKDNCERNNQHEVLALVAKVGTFAVERLKTVIKNMPEFTLHDDTHIFTSDPDSGTSRAYDRTQFEKVYNFQGKRAIYYEN